MTKSYLFITYMARLPAIKRATSKNDNLILGGDLNAKLCHKLDKKYPSDKPTNKYQGYVDFLHSIKNPSDPKSQEARLDSFLVPKSLEVNSKVKILDFDINVSCDHKAILYQDDITLVPEINSEPPSPPNFQPSFRVKVTTNLASVEDIKSGMNAVLNPFFRSGRMMFSPKSCLASLLPPKKLKPHL